MTQPLTFVILAAEALAARELRDALEADPRARVITVCRTPQQAYAEMVRLRPAAVVLELGRQPEIIWQLCQQIREVAPETVVICAAAAASTDLILSTLRSGAQEFLRLPLQFEELQTVLDRTFELCASQAQTAKKSGQVIAVFSSRGGCGTSFIAANLAVGLNAPTVLVDLNVQSGSLDLFFGVKPRFSVLDFIENRARLDDPLLATLLTPYNERLSLLPAPQDAADVEGLRPEQIGDSIDLLREKFAYVVLDLPHTFDAITIGALDHADHILLVLELDIVSARATQRALAIFQRLGYPRQKVRLVLNRWNSQSDLALKDIEHYLAERIASLLSDDYGAVVSSINLGKPLLDAGTASTLVSELKRLISFYAPAAAEPAAAQRKGLLDVFFRRQTSPLQQTTTPLQNPPKPDTQPLRPQRDEGTKKQGPGLLSEVYKP